MKSEYQQLLDELQQQSTRHGPDHATCCLTGKDADLEPWGEQSITTVAIAWDTVSFYLECYKTFAGNDVCLNLTWEEQARTENCDDAYEAILRAYLEMASEVIMDSHLPIEWDGDNWDCSMKKVVVCQIERYSDQSIDCQTTVKKMLETAEKALEDWDEEVSYLDFQLSALAGWEEWNPTTERFDKCKLYHPGPGAAWRMT